MYLKDGEMNILHELSRFQEVIAVILEQTKDATSLPQSGEQVLLDIKSSNNTCIYQVCCRYIITSYMYILFVILVLSRAVLVGNGEGNCPFPHFYDRINMYCVKH